MDAAQERKDRAAALHLREKLKKQHGTFEDRDRFGDDCLVADMGVTFDFSGRTLVINRFGAAPTQKLVHCKSQISHKQAARKGDFQRNLENRHGSQTSIGMTAHENSQVLNPFGSEVTDTYQMERLTNN